MRYGADRKEQSRREIVARAAERLRRDGIAAVGVRTLMSDAGMTHGAFYAHFGSRDDLVAQALERAIEATRDGLLGHLENVPAEHRFEAVVDAYLRPIHRDHVAKGCAAAALAPEIARLDDETRGRFWRGVGSLADVIEPLLPPGGSDDERRTRAHALFASLMGSLQLARAVPDAAESERMLAGGRDAALAIARSAWSST
jgi:TetR/AcrR family transcriptional repressor of nem operon